MLAGCSTLVSPRHRLRSEASAQFQACNFQLPSMSTQRLDLPCSFPRKDASTRSQPIRPVGLSIENPIEVKTSCSLKPNIRIKDEYWEKGKSLKRFAEQGLTEDSLQNRAKRTRGISNSSNPGDDSSTGGEFLRLGQLGSGNFWFQPGIEFNHPQVPFSLSCSREEERLCFVPSEGILPPCPLPKNPWVESVVTSITDLGEKNVETSERVIKEDSGSSSSSHSRSFDRGVNENASDHETGSGLRLLDSHEGIEAETGNEEDNRGDDHHGFELISLLMACVEAISSKNIAAINHFIAKLGEVASPKGSPISRLTAYFTESLALRVVKLWPHIFHIMPPRELDQAEDDNGTAIRLLNQVSPIPKFLHFTSNEILLRAFEGKDRVHIIDFDIKQGLQWPSLFQSLASRTNPPTHVRITGIGESKQELNETGDRLAGFAEALNLPFEFHSVVDRLEDVRLWMLHVKERECVGVNCILQLHKMLYDGSGGAIRDLMGLIRSTNPVVVVMAEQEAEHNDPCLETRVSNSLKYYSAIFDSVDSSLPLDSPAKIKIEEMFSREIRNIVACEGRDRFERHESFDKWRKLVAKLGFRCLGISDREMLQGQMLLKMFSCDNYSVKKQDKDGSSALTLSWLDQPLYSVSAWAPVDVDAGSSAFSLPS